MVVRQRTEMVEWFGKSNSMAEEHLSLSNVGKEGGDLIFPVALRALLGIWKGYCSSGDRKAASWMTTSFKTIRVNVVKCSVSCWGIPPLRAFKSLSGHDNDSLGGNFNSHFPNIPKRALRLCYASTISLSLSLSLKRGLMSSCDWCGRYPCTCTLLYEHVRVTNSNANSACTCYATTATTLFSAVALYQYICLRFHITKSIGSVLFRHLRARD